MADYPTLASVLAEYGPDEPITTANVLGRMAVPDPLSNPRGYISDYLRRQGKEPSPGLANALAQEPPKQEPNWLGKAMEAIPPEAMFAANFIAPNVRLPVPRVQNPIKAYHGSPHDFDKFDLSKIGTGEGAQAYGHGLYFAERPEVAQQYREKLSSSIGARSGELSFANMAWRQAGKNKEAALAYIDGELARAASEKWPEAATRQIKGARELVLNDSAELGRMYEVALHASPEQFLDWDKPLSQMSEGVRKALADNWLAHPESHAHQDGRAIYGALGRAPSFDPNVMALRPDEQVTRMLSEAGIPGIKYLDQGSRGAGQGTSNYVVWSPEIIEILKKYGIAAPIAGAPTLANILSGDGEQ